MYDNISPSAAAPMAPTAPPSPPLALMCQELQERGWPVSLLKAFLPNLLRHARELAPTERCTWLHGLHEAWHRHGWALGGQARALLFELAAAWCAWPLAYVVGASLLRDGALDAAFAARMLQTRRGIGDAEGALDLAISLQLADPFQPRHALAYRELASWRAWRDAAAPVDAFPRDGLLRLEPLAHHHAADFAWQYYDPAIAERCCLPHFDDEAQWHRWLDTVHGYGDQLVFAVLHRDWGFVGCTSLVLHAGIGFFYYWIGRDFQGREFGPCATALMLEGARRRFGLRSCYAKVYDDNLPSRRALAKMGFDDLGICAAVPEQRQLFYRQGEPQVRERIVAELHELMAYLGSDIRVAAPLGATTRPWTDANHIQPGPERPHFHAATT